MPDRVHVVWVGLLEESLEVVGGRSRLMLVVVHDSCDVPHVGDARLSVIAIIIVDRGRSSLRTLFAPPLAALDTLPSALDSDVEWRLPTAAWGCLPASCRMTKFGRITTGGILGGDTAQLLGGVHENVINFSLARVQRAAFRSHARIPVVNLSTSLGLGVSTLSP
jgi:hypothetical protein